MRKVLYGIAVISTLSFTTSLQSADARVAIPNQPIQKHLTNTPVNAPNNASTTSKCDHIIKFTGFLSDKGVSAVVPFLPHIISGDPLFITHGSLHICGTLGSLLTSLYIHKPQWESEKGTVHNCCTYLIMPLLIACTHITSTVLSFLMLNHGNNKEIKEAQSLFILFPGALHIINHAISHYADKD